MAATEIPETPDARAGAIVLAAGRGVRMHSATPKVLHPVGGIPMVERVRAAVRAAGLARVVMVVDDLDGPLRATLPTDVILALQSQPLGTADATRVGLQALDPLPAVVLVVGGDTPLLTDRTLRATLDAVPEATIALAAAVRDDPTGYGRVIVDASGRLERIVEEADAAADERAVRLTNGMVFAFDARWLADHLSGVQPAPNGERYLTSLVAMAVAEGRPVAVIPASDQWEIMGVNTRRELAEAEAALRHRVVLRHLDAGVSILDPATTYIDEAVRIGRDVVIHPQSYLRGTTVVGDACVLGPGAEVIDSRLGPGTRVWWSVVEGAETAERVTIGPYCRLRPGAMLGADVAIGSFAEVKNSTFGNRTQMHHFGYVGDAEVGADVNIGAGVVTVNYDGVEKHRTLIGAGAFVGSDSLLIAPVRVGDGALTGAGAVVTHDVPDGTVVVGVPARPHTRRPPAGDDPRQE